MAKIGIDFKEKYHKNLGDIESRFNERINKVESNVIDRIAAQFMQTIDNEHNSQIRFQCEFEKRYIEFEKKNIEFENEIKTYLNSLKYTVMSLDHKITPKWHSLLIITISIISFSTIIVMLLTKI